MSLHFSSESEALQHLSDITGKKIIVANEKLNNLLEFLDFNMWDDLEDYIEQEHHLDYDVSEYQEAFDVDRGYKGDVGAAVEHIGFESDNDGKIKIPFKDIEKYAGITKNEIEEMEDKLYDKMLKKYNFNVPTQVGAIKVSANIVGMDISDNSLEFKYEIKDIVDEDDASERVIKNG